METSRRLFLLGSGSLLMPKMPQSLFSPIGASSHDSQDMFRIIANCFYHPKVIALYQLDYSSKKPTADDVQDYLKERNADYVKVLLRLRHIDLKEREKLAKDEEIASKLRQLMSDCTDKEHVEEMIRTNMLEITQDQVLESMMEYAIGWVDRFTLKYFSQIADKTLCQDLIAFARREPQALEVYFDPDSPTSHRGVFMSVIESMQTPVLSGDMLSNATIEDTGLHPEKSVANGIVRSFVQRSKDRTKNDGGDKRDQIALSERPTLQADPADAMTTLDQK